MTHQRLRLGTPIHCCRRHDSNMRVKSQLVWNPFCPILCPDMCPHIYGTTAICLSVMLSCLSCQKECTNTQALSESLLEVCILTRRVHVPGPTRLGKMSKPLCLPDFVSGTYARGTREIIMSGNTPRILLLHIQPTDPLRGICLPADSPQRDFGKAGSMVL